MNAAGARRLGMVLGLSLVVGVLGAALWAWWAEPAHWQVLQGRIVMTEYDSRAVFPVMLRFGVVGVALSLLLGLVGQLLLRVDWSDAVLIASGAVVASLVAWRLGIILGPPDPTTVSGLKEGDIIEERLAVGSVVPFLAWPIGALLGVLVAGLFDRDRPDQPRPDQGRAMGATTAWVDDTRS